MWGKLCVGSSPTFSTTVLSLRNTSTRAKTLRPTKSQILDNMLPNIYRGSPVVNDVASKIWGIFWPIAFLPVPPLRLFPCEHSQVLITSKCRGCHLTLDIVRATFPLAPKIHNSYLNIPWNVFWLWESTKGLLILIPEICLHELTYDPINDCKRD